MGFRSVRIYINRTTQSLNWCGFKCKEIAYPRLFLVYDAELPPTLLSFECVQINLPSMSAKRLCAEYWIFSGVPSRFAKDIFRPRAPRDTCSQIYRGKVSLSFREELSIIRTGFKGTARRKMCRGKSGVAACNNSAIDYPGPLKTSAFS